MSFNFQDIAFGWKALATVIITGTTIFIVSNTRKQVEQIDVLEIILGAHERCLVTWNASGGSNYWTEPLEFERDLVTNVYSASSSIIVTQKVTNVFGWYTDRTLYGSGSDGLDQNIRDVLTVYVNPTNANADPWYSRWTVAEMWAYLQIGDKTSLFTRSFGGTNPVAVTNYVVNYTSYYPLEDGTTTNVIYTTTQNHVVSYATNWNGTNWGWGVISNWASFTTNQVFTSSFGPAGGVSAAGQIESESLVERYKVLYMLSNCAWMSTAIIQSNQPWVSNGVIYVWYKAEDIPGVGVGWQNPVSHRVTWNSGNETNFWYGVYQFWNMNPSEPCFYPDNSNSTPVEFSMLNADTESRWAASGGFTGDGTPQSYIKVSLGRGWTPGSGFPYYYWVRSVEAKASSSQIIVGPFSNSPSHSFTVEACTVAHADGGTYGGNGTIGGYESEWQVLYSVTNSTNTYDEGSYFGDNAYPEWVQPDPNEINCTNASYGISKTLGNQMATRVTAAYDPGVLSHWVENGSTEAGDLGVGISGITTNHFLYCTNKFW